MNEKQDPPGGLFSTYLKRGMDFQQLTAERKKQLARIAAAREHSILVYAADPTKQRPGISPSITPDDLLPIEDQLASLNNSHLDVILHTPGGSGECVEDIVHLLRQRFEHVSFIIPGIAKSAGTIMAMSGDEILMGPASSLGPIDAQIFWRGNFVSAHSMLEGLEKLAKKVAGAQALNRAYVPILSNLSPGDIEAFGNAQAFGKTLVKEFLETYKFRHWEFHSSDGRPVTKEERSARASEIAEKLSDSTKWLTHARSIRMDHLREMGLAIEDYTKNEELHDAITRYYVLLQLTFQIGVLKVVETPHSEMTRNVAVQPPGFPAQMPIIPGIPAMPAQVPSKRPQKVKGPGAVQVQVGCGKCGHQIKIQADMGERAMLQDGFTRFPEDDKLTCPGCGKDVVLSDIRKDLENRFKQRIV